LKAGAIEYSPELSKLGLKWQLWQKIIHYKQNQFKDKRFIKTIA